MNNKITEAFDLVLVEINELKKSGIRVEIIEPRSVREKDNKENKEHFKKLIKEYPDIDYTKWRNVSFFPKGLEMKKIYELEKRLRVKGIYFDTGSSFLLGASSRDWELDWSFRCK